MPTIQSSDHQRKYRLSLMSLCKSHQSTLIPPASKPCRQGCVLCHISLYTIAWPACSVGSFCAQRPPWASTARSNTLRENVAEGVHRRPQRKLLHARRKFRVSASLLPALEVNSLPLSRRLRSKKRRKLGSASRWRICSPKPIILELKSMKY